MAGTWAEQDFDEWERSAENFEKRLPKCDVCREPIYGEYEYHIDGERMCEDCADDWWQKVKEEAKRTSEVIE